MNQKNKMGITLSSPLKDILGSDSNTSNTPNSNTPLIITKETYEENLKQPLTNESWNMIKHNWLELIFGTIEETNQDQERN